MVNRYENLKKYANNISYMEDTIYKACILFILKSSF